MRSQTNRNLKTDKRKIELIRTLATCKNIGEKAEQHYSSLLEETNRLKENEELQELFNILKVFSNKDRLLILNLLQKKDRCVCELECALGKAQSAISRHLKQLEDIKVIQGWKDGKFTHYSLIKFEFNKYQQILAKWIGNVENWFEELPKRQ